VVDHGIGQALIAVELDLDILVRIHDVVPGEQRVEYTPETENVGPRRMERLAAKDQRVDEAGRPADILKVLIVC
jgi:hypothetical protein